jgi:hypothetical protein
MDMTTIAQQLNIKEFPFIIKDKKGNEIYFESSHGYWIKKEYKDDKQVYYENSDGYWWKSEWKEGNEIYYENSEGYWFKSKFNDGNEIYYEDRDGIIRDNRPKERPCVGKKVTIDGVEYELK